MTNKRDQNSQDTTVRAQSQSEQLPTDSNQKWNILSPDGIPVTDEPFASKEEAEAFIPKYCKRFVSQGYYAAVYCRISLENLPLYLTVTPEDDLWGESITDGDDAIEY